MYEALGLVRLIWELSPHCRVVAPDFQVSASLVRAGGFRFWIPGLNNGSTVLDLRAAVASPAAPAQVDELGQELEVGPR
jgi:hypothetical protein